MRRLLLIALFIPVTGCDQNKAQSFSVGKTITSQEGWQGRRFFQNDLVIAEEFDAVKNDGRIDLWRFYDQGNLILEERDRNADGRVDYTADFERIHGELRKLVSDTNFDGKDDLWLDFYRSRWRQRRDRNFDGYVDFEFTFEGPSNLVSQAKVDLPNILDLREIIAPKYWDLVSMDTNYDGLMDTWERYDNGLEVERGFDTNKNGRPDRWVRVVTALSDTGKPTIEANGLTRITGTVEDPVERQRRERIQIRRKRTLQPRKPVASPNHTAPASSANKESPLDAIPPAARSITPHPSSNLAE